MSPDLAHALRQADPATVGARIKAARSAAGLTQPGLGGAEASAAYLSRIETGQRHATAGLIEVFASRLGVTPEYLVHGATREDARRLELELDHGELSLAGGEAGAALERARRVLGAKDLHFVPDGPARAAYLEAAALDALDAVEAKDAFVALLDTHPSALIRARAATALSRILRERGEAAAAVACGEQALDSLRPDLLGSEEGVRLAVTVAAALYEAGHTDRATLLCDEAVVEAERLASPLARASAYWNASIVRSESGDLDEALTLARNALSLMESTERVRDMGRLRMQFCDMMLKVNPPRLAEIQHQLRLADSELDWSAASPADAAWHHVVSARAMAMAGELDAARARAADAAVAATGHLPMVEVAALILLGQIDWSNDDQDAARRWFIRAITVLTGVGSDRDAGQLWFELATLADQAGLVDEARDAYRRAAASTGLAARLSKVTRPRVKV